MGFVHSEGHACILSISEQGLKFAFDVRTTLNVSNIIFHPSTTTHSYDLYATSADKGDILFLNLETGNGASSCRPKTATNTFFTLLGKVDIITGVGKPLESHLVEWGAPNRPVSSSGIFGSFLITPASEAVFVINGDTRTVNCEIGGLIHPRHVLWMPSRP